MPRLIEAPTKGLTESAVKRKSKKMFNAYEQAFIIAEELIAHDPAFLLDKDLLWKTHKMLREHLCSVEKE